MAGPFQDGELGDEIVLTNTMNAGMGKTFRKMFRSRDIFLHDGVSLRRVRIGSGIQLAAAVAFVVILFWSVFAATQLAAGTTAPSPADVSRMEREVKAMQADVAAIKLAAQQRYQLTAQEVRSLGLDPRRMQAATGVGGPYEPVDTASTADPNFKALFMSWKKLESLEQGTVAIPSALPVQGTNFTSGFGVRSDPFRGRAAMHPGVDMAGPAGSPIYATADGVVDRAEWNTGGYGNLVEIDHGHGIQTRYGHLTRYIVSAGEHVKRGQLIAYMGSTGRSTGSHLHYEVRLDGKAVNPIPFMQSSDFLQSVQRRAAAATAIAVGGPEVETAD
ncbi:MAG: family metallopeptidase [Alphaproteobacteria bacterium]|nr:family metallopeptidase [Alphaproteobacteria bacterium]